MNGVGAVMANAEIAVVTTLGNVVANTEIIDKKLAPCGTFISRTNPGTVFRRDFHPAPSNRTG